MNFIKQAKSVLKERKKFLMFPIILVMILIVLLIVTANSSANSPFIYSLY